MAREGFCARTYSGYNQPGEWRVFCYQYGGESKSGPPPDGGQGGWRCLSLKKLSSVELLDGAWRTAPHAHHQRREITIGGVCLGGAQENAIEMPVATVIVDAVASEAETMPGEPATVRSLQSAVGLVWRALLLWMLLLLLLSMAVWLA